MATEAQVDFIRTEIQAGFTMLRLAHTERLLSDLDAILFT